MKLTTKGEAPKAATRPEFEIELLATTTTTLLEHEGLASTTTKAASEGVTLGFIRVGVIASVEPGPKLGIAQDLVCLVDAGHLLLRLFLG